MMGNIDTTKLGADLLQAQSDAEAEDAMRVLTASLQVIEKKPPYDRDSYDGSRREHSAIFNTEAICHAVESLRLAVLSGYATRIEYTDLPLSELSTSDRDLIGEVGRQGIMAAALAKRELEVIWRKTSRWRPIARWRRKWMWRNADAMFLAYRDLYNEGQATKEEAAADVSEHFDPGPHGEWPGYPW
jgi:hypothetical protein